MTSKRQPNRRSLSLAKLDEMIEEATVDAYGESEEKATRPSLLTDVELFEKASLAGEYYESFGVNSQNYTQNSAGTSAWIAEHLRLLDRCVINAKKSNRAEVREAMDILFGLLNHIDKGDDDVIFFADEGGSWQVGVDWAKVLPVWFKVLSATAEPKEYAERITALLSCHYRYGRDKMLEIARRTAMTDQRKALRDVAASIKSGGSSSAQPSA